MTDYFAAQYDAHGRDFLIEVVKGNVPKHSIVHKFGRNDDVPNGSWEHVSYRSTTTSYITAALPVRTASGGNAADDDTGNGARQIEVQGIDSDGNLATEAITPNGTGASSNTTTSFFRIFRAYVTTSGTYGAANTGDITVETNFGTDLVAIPAGEGQTFYAGYTVPLGRTAYITSAFLTVDAGKTVDVRLITRGDCLTTSAPVAPVLHKLRWVGLGAGLHALLPRSPLGGYAALTDIWWEAYGVGGTAAVSIDFELLVIED